MKAITKKLCAVLFSTALLAGCGTSAPKESPLPSPELESGLRGEQFGIDANINEATIDQYLGRTDTVYRDMRMLKDEADYEAIGGDAWLSGIVEGFEVVPYPYLVNVEGLPPEVGNSYTGNTLFTHDASGYTANYMESMDILEYLFPKDKNIILMCGGGGYAGMTKTMLGELGWDTSRIYNAGGYWFYEGSHSVPIKREENGETFYDFYKLNYHHIDFSSLHRITPEADVKPEQPSKTPEASSAVPAIDTDTLKTMIQNQETFFLSLYLPGCSACASFAPVVEELAASDQIPFFSMSLADADLSGTPLDGKAKYTPSAAVFKDGRLMGMLDPNADEDTDYFRNAENLSSWINTMIPFETVTGSAENDTDTCGEACTAFGDLQ